MVGPFLDKTDGVTEEAGLAGVGTELSKAGAAFGAGPVLGTLDSDGWYPITLTTTHTNTLGDLTIKVHDAATHLPVWAHFTVIPANAFDAMVSGSGVGMRSDVQGWLGTAPATPTTNGVPEVDVTFVSGAAVPAGAIPNAVAGAAGGLQIAGSNAATTYATLTVTGATTLTGNIAAAAGITVTQSTLNGHGISVTGNGTGHGILSTSGSGVTGDGLRAVAASTNGNGITGVKTGSGSDLNATVTPLVLAKTTNLTGLNDIAATAIVSAGAITTLSGAVVNVDLVDLTTTATNLTNLPAAAALEATLTSMKGATFAEATDSLEAIRDRGDAAWDTATGFSTLVATDIVSGGAITTSGGAVSAVTTTTNLTTNNDKIGYALSAAGSAALTEGYPADGATGTLAQILYEIKAFLGEKNISGTTVTTKKLDGSTTAATYTLDSATAPTTITRAT